MVDASNQFFALAAEPITRTQDFRLDQVHLSFKFVDAGEGMYALLSEVLHRESASQQS